MQISIKEFLKIESLSLDLQAPINIIVGENEAGKSSIRDALCWCLTGEARGLKTHQQQAALIRNGAKAAEVKTTLPDGSEVFRKKTPKTPASVIGAVPEDGGITAILCDPLAFLGFAEDKRREILFRLIPGLNPKRKGIGDRLLGWLSEDLLDEWMLQAVGDLSIMAESKGFAIAEKEAVTCRQVAKRLRKEAEVEEEPMTRATIGDKEYILPDIQETEVDKGLTKLQATRDQLLQKKGLLNAELGKLPNLERELTALESNRIPAPDPSERDRLQSALKVAQHIMADLKKQVDSPSTAKEPKYYPSLCPAFPGSGIVCPRGGMLAIEGQKAFSPGKRKKLEADFKAQKEKVALLEEDLQKAKEKQKAYEEYPKKHVELAAKVVSFKEKIEAAAKLDQEIDDLDTRLQVGRDLLEAVRNFWRKMNEADVANAKLAKADKEAVFYDKLAKALAPEGIPSQLIAQALKPINELLKVAAAHLFPGRTLALNQDLDIELSGSPYIILCKSEQFRVGLAFQYALVKLAGAHLMMIDEADILDPQNRGQLIGLLLEIQPEFDTIMVFATADNARPSLNPDIQVWVLLDGKIHPLNKGFRFKDGEIIPEAEEAERKAA